MADRRYDVQTELPRNPRRRAAWLCTAGMLNWATAKRDLVRTHQKLRRLWYRRLMTLRKAGWERVQTKALQWMRNCPPAGLWDAGPPMDTCDHADLCPFCWGRLRVEPFYAWLDRWRQHAPEAEGMRWCMSRWSWRAEEPVWPDGRKQFYRLKRSGAVAGVILQWWEPVRVAPGGPPWRLRRTGVVLTRGKGTPDLGEGGKAKHIFSDRLTRHLVYRATLKCARFPIDILRCPPEMCLEMLRRRVGHRGLRTFGRLAAQDRSS